MRHVLLLALLVLTAGCADVECEKHTDCQTPMDYLVQSNCPYGAACIDGGCYVVCADTKTDYIGHELPVACEIDADCDCSNRGERTLDCACVDGGCLSIEDKIPN